MIQQADFLPEPDFSPRGWPVVGRGSPRVECAVTYRQWRERLSLPEESADFSDRDAFDLALFLIEHPPPDFKRFHAEADDEDDLSGDALDSILPGSRIDAGADPESFDSSFDPAPVTEE